MAETIHQLRIHGDNILECESALKLLASSLNGGAFELVGGTAYAPVYAFTANTGEKFVAQLFPGYGRWNFPLEEYIASLGGTLREAPDAVITKLEEEDGTPIERPMLALEFSGALPAGNNAWQRTGRALALAYAGIPYLYFAELGGQELDAKRVVKAARFPNPLVPFAYAVLGMNSSSISLPVYIPSPSIHAEVVEIYKDCFGDKDSIELIRTLLLSADTTDTKSRIEKKVAKIIELLATQRKRADILKPEEWAEFYAQGSGLAKAQWLIKKAMPWNKKVGIKPITPTFPRLLKAVNDVKAAAIGSRDMPICIIAPEGRADFAKQVQGIYKTKISDEFSTWVATGTRPLLCVWVAGFKPRGDDSRPDRGLVPLARMIFGLEDVDLLTVVYGPAKPSTWAALRSDMSKLAATNGLWEAIINLSNALIVDSATGTSLPDFGFIVPKRAGQFEKLPLRAASETPHFGEHDVDSALHLLFSDAVGHGVYESMCNPPGGDWSGINVFDFDNDTEYRWTSLPRVSGALSKRPDHLIQMRSLGTLLSIESKDVAARLEDKIGPRLIKYAKTLLAKAPIAFRKRGEPSYSRYEGKALKGFEFLSGAAFRFQGEAELRDSLKSGRVDLVIGVEFNTAEKLVVLHLVTSAAGKALVPVINDLAERRKGFFKVQTR
ncbi:hypothetical protein KGM48_01480 [Patescibacteria group bacterium]|nr:hypothetical protein [Patescibacteria group bacterium]